MQTLVLQREHGHINLVTVCIVCKVNGCLIMRTARAKYHMQRLLDTPVEDIILHVYTIEAVTCHQSTLPLEHTPTFVMSADFCAVGRSFV